MNLSHAGRTYGPYRYEVGAEKIREFAAAIGGGQPSRIHAWEPADQPRAYWDDEWAAANGGLVAPPTFVVTFAIRPFVACTLDPALGLDLLRLVHGEQDFQHLAPVRAGDVVSTHGSIAEHFEKGGLEFVIVKSESTNQRGEVVLKATWTAIVRKAT